MARRIRLAKGIAIYTRDDAQGWWADLSRHGARVKVSLGTDNRKEAEAEARRRHSDLGSKRPSSYSLDDALAAWLKERPRTDREKSAIRVLRERYEDRRAEEVDTASIAAALSDKAPGTFNRTLSIIRAALRLAEAHGHIDRAPSFRRKREPPARIRFITGDEYGRLRAELAPHLLAPFEFALATGQRQANVLGLKWSQIHDNVMVIDAVDYKQGRGHAIPLGEHAMGILRGEEGKHPEFVFTYRGRPFKRPKTGYRNAKKRAGVENLTWHDLRHSFASWMLMAGAPLVAVKEAGGWASMESVARYAHLEKKQLADHADKGIQALKNRHENRNAPKKVA